MTKKELLEAIKDMPEDAEIEYLDYDNYYEEANDYLPTSEVYYHERRMTIVIR